MLAPWKKRYDKPRQHFKKQRHHFAKKTCLVKAMFFPVVIYGCESWNHKEGWESNNWNFWVVVLEKTVESTFAARRSNWSILKETNHEYLLEGLIQKLKLQSFGDLMRAGWLIGKDPDAGKDWRQRRREWQRMRWLDSITALMNMDSSTLWEIVKTGKLGVLQSVRSQSQIRLSNSTTKREKNKALLQLD